MTVVFMYEASSNSERKCGMNDSDLIMLYCMRSESAITETQQKYGSYCTKIAMNVLGDRNDAEECINDAYLAVWNVIPPQKPTVFRAFLGKITRNLAFDRYKARNAKKRGGTGMALILDELADCIPAATDVEAEYDAKLTSEAIGDFLYTAGYEQRAVFVRRYWYTDSIADLAARFNMSESKVKSMLMRTRNKLKIYLEERGISFN